ncbi:hypothetical protein [Staphylococcus aureus]|uniref:hypothetical protein n=1 Tax=Staphylococcus aureus TaxID=1280 RepID=UPI0015F4216F|nr:hypothetical protein [Staphylococcus aureus]MBA8634144.1 hypothetical protein [Staphylococcus aureus]
MIENYVEWFCVFINVPYERNETLESWVINRKQNKEFEIGNVSVLQNNYHYAILILTFNSCNLHKCNLHLCKLKL